MGAGRRSRWHRHADRGGAPTDKEGTDRHDIGREAFIERVWQWVNQYKSRIQDQHRRLGASCDWSRERFTLDEGLSKAVREVFVRLYEEGLIYRGERIINWCPVCMSAISDLEVNHVDTPGTLTYVRYPLKPTGGRTARRPSISAWPPRVPKPSWAIPPSPSIPHDARYKDIIGRLAILPVIGREIPIIADEAVDASFRHGRGQGDARARSDRLRDRHAPQPAARAGDRLRRENDRGGRSLRRAGSLEARKNLVEELEQLGLIVKIEDYTVPLGHCQRCDTIVEPLISKQWFVKMAPLATPAMGAVKYGQMKIVPERFNKVYMDWLENIHDWCISRQLWWGHRIPVWYCDNCGADDRQPRGYDHLPALRQHGHSPGRGCAGYVVQFVAVAVQHAGLARDDTPDLRRYYPTSVMETGYDIIFFWVARMAMAGMHFLGTIPFHTIYLHGLVRDAKGEKMSKSKNNVIDPLEVMDQVRHRCPALHAGNEQHARQRYEAGA